MENNDKKPNALIHEKSPYLLQHAYNPVHWYPWGEEAFARAREEGKAVFLSIGYSTCHWCHVMAHESFENPEIAELINDAFIPVKVDREERPDIDSVYMSVCLALTGGGGWPLTIIMTPDKEPFFAGTYIPAESRFGHPGLRKIIPQLRSLWVLNRGEALSISRRVVAALRQESADIPGGEPDEALLTRAYEQLEARYDSEYGGFGKAPRFPSPHNLFFLLRYWNRTGEEKALEMVEKTLEHMGNGGIYDHVGFGFHRYSTDERWLVPHFEKMLYDQALISIAYVEAFQATGKPSYRKKAEQIFEYVLRDLTSPGGGFYSAEDADSEGEEGKYYVWTETGLDALLGSRKAALVKEYFNVTGEGNYKDETSRLVKGDNILHCTRSIEALLSGQGIPGPELEALLESARKELFEARRKRVSPHRDDKILADWNGLMIAALAKGGRVFREQRYIDAAEKAAHFIRSELSTHQGRLLHRYRDGQAGIRAYLDDYAFTIWGLLELYEATFTTAHFRRALDLNRLVLEHFSDDGGGGFFTAADDGEELIVRKKELYDGAIPSGNSVMAMNLLRLARMTGDWTLEEKASLLARAFAGSMSASPVAYTYLMTALSFALGPAYEIIISGEPHEDMTKAFIEEVGERFLPEKVVLLNRSGEQDRDLLALAPFLREYGSREGRSTAYICARHMCRAPLNDTAGLAAFFEGEKAGV